MFDILYCILSDAISIGEDSMLSTSKFCDAANGLVNRSEQPFPVSTAILD